MGIPRAGAQSVLQIQQFMQSEKRKHAVVVIHVMHVFLLVPHALRLVL